MFSLAGHQRQRLIFPLVPPLALVAGRELARGLAAWRPGVRRAAVTAAAGAWLLGTALYTFTWHAQKDEVRATVAMRDAARALRTLVGPSLVLTHTDTPFAFRFYLGDLGPRTPMAAAAARLEGQASVLVAVSRLDLLRQALPAGAPVHEVWHWPPAGEPRLWVVSNRPGLTAAVIRGP
jgi:hypothetical protein